MGRQNTNGCKTFCSAFLVHRLTGMTSGTCALQVGPSPILLNFDPLFREHKFSTADIYRTLFIAVWLIDTYFPKFVNLVPGIPRYAYRATTCVSPSLMHLCVCVSVTPSTKSTNFGSRYLAEGLSEPKKSQNHHITATVSPSNRCCDMAILRFFQDCGCPLDRSLGNLTH